MEEFESWVRARQAALARSAYLLTGDLHLAEDLLQETLARVAARWHRLDRSRPPSAYASTVMHRLAIDAWRRRRVRPAEVLSDQHPELGGHGADVERRLVLRDALARLTPKQRAVLSLRFYEDLTEVQTADVLGISVSTVKTTARDALTRLRAVAPDLLADAIEDGSAR
ncbi:SigE family RNA polymerase sigma factor [Nocardioides sp. SYSU D00038]|uniref:SigE family RNA polymerase sigma factor n=1 Tax=Nocardioides sp. SYSU D00038 TaxID=2812554 RepID=UPI0027DB98D6|nr:SigE family RNA polymerase sigma factor [Nocardioides sp. SYSU D00038]